MPIEKKREGSKAFCSGCHGDSGPNSGGGEEEERGEGKKKISKLWGLLVFGKQGKMILVSHIE